MTADSDRFKSHLDVGNPVVISKRKYAVICPGFSTLRTHFTRLVRYGSLHHETILFIVIPTLYFRLFPFILTHNSMTLSAYLAATFVYIPFKVASALWRRYWSLLPRLGGGHGKKKSLLPLLPWSPTQAHGSPAPWRVCSNERVGKASDLYLWLFGAVFTLWVYRWGSSSPFPTASSVISSSPTLRAHQSRNASYFIAASFFNNEEILDSWSSEMLKLIDTLGPSNVYVSLTENDSEDNTASRLLHFGNKLRQRNVTHSLNITSGLRGYPSNNPWKSIEHRMEYMANLRNGALEPLGRLNRRFENVIILNDVVYHHTDVLKLIAALGGDDQNGIGDGRLRRPRTANKLRRRRMACSLDMDGATLYDTWVLRDRCGMPVSGFWPFFSSKYDRRYVQRGQVLDVSTCWNGIVVLEGDMMLEPQLRNKDADWAAETLRFQQPPDCIISECALLPLKIVNTTGGASIVVDPTVVVAYSAKWWRYYAVWLRMPVVRLWMNLFEEAYWKLWWRMGMGNALIWRGLDDGREKGECLVEGWPQCADDIYAERGAIRLRRRASS